MKRGGVALWLDMRVLALGGGVALSVLAWTVPAAAQNTPVTGAPAASAAPASAPSAPTADVESLRERAAAFWAARVAGNFTAEWELLEPRARGRMTADEYGTGRGAVKYLAYQVEDASANGYFATVKVRVMAQPFLPTASLRPVPPGAVVVQDRWVKVQGTWYRSLEQD